MKTLYVIQLSKDIQDSILEELKGLGLSPEDIEDALNSRLTDLSDTIDITKYL